MATLAELVQEHTDLEGPVVAHLQRLVAGWGVLSDLCFADLLLFVPVRGRRRALRGARPGPADDQPDPAPRGPGREGHRRRGAAACGPGLAARQRGGGRGRHPAAAASTPGWCASRCAGRAQLVALLTRESALAVGRRPGQLERVYVEVFDRLARMMSQGEFPFPVDEVGDRGDAAGRRRGDGARRQRPGGLRVAERRQRPAPHGGVLRHRGGAPRRGRSRRSRRCRWPIRPGCRSTEEIGDGSDIAVVLRCVPLLDHGAVTGALVLMRDVSDLRRRDRLLLSKDAAIREVHHRVKNNLQTISSLLRLQARRMPAGRGPPRPRGVGAAGPLASRSCTRSCPATPPTRSTSTTSCRRWSAWPRISGSDDRPVRISYRGEAGELQASVATPLAVVVTELLQNAAEHAVRRGLRLARDARRRWPGRHRGAGPAATVAGGRRAVPSDAELRVTVSRQRGRSAAPASPSTTPPASGCPSSAAWSAPRWGAPSPCATKAGRWSSW